MFAEVYSNDLPLETQESKEDSCSFFQSGVGEHHHWGTEKLFQGDASEKTVVGGQSVDA